MQFKDFIENCPPLSEREEVQINLLAQYLKRLSLKKVSLFLMSIRKAVTKDFIMEVHPYEKSLRK